MKFYCIRFIRHYYGGLKDEKKFFVYAETKLKAEQRFLQTTGYSRKDVVTIIEVE